MLRIFIFFIMVQLTAQNPLVQVVTEDLPNRLAFYAVNESLTDYDVKITITGTNFRQSRAKPRMIRVPAASKVHLKTIILIRGKKPNYNYDLIMNDSLSNRAMKKPFKKVKINPKKQITVYVPSACLDCDSLIAHLTAGKYKFTSYIIGENKEIASQLQRSFGNAQSPIDSLETPIVNLGGTLHTKISTYQELLDVLLSD